MLKYVCVLYRGDVLLLERRIVQFEGVLDEKFRNRKTNSYITD